MKLEEECIEILGELEGVSKDGPDQNILHTFIECSKDKYKYYFNELRI